MEGYKPTRKAVVLGDETTPLPRKALRADGGMPPPAKAALALPPETKTEVFYRVSATSPRGFWRIKRLFSTVPVEIPASSLSPEEAKALTDTDRRHLVVERITR